MKPLLPVRAHPPSSLSLLCSHSIGFLQAICSGAYGPPPPQCSSAHPCDLAFFSQCPWVTPTLAPCLVWHSSRLGEEWSHTLAGYKHCRCLMAGLEQREETTQPWVDTINSGLPMLDFKLGTKIRSPCLMTMWPNT